MTIEEFKTTIIKQWKNIHSDIQYFVLDGIHALDTTSNVSYRSIALFCPEFNVRVRFDECDWSDNRHQYQSWGKTKSEHIPSVLHDVFFQEFSKEEAGDILVCANDQCFSFIEEYIDIKAGVVEMGYRKCVLVVDKYYNFRKEVLNSDMATSFSYKLGSKTFDGDAELVMKHCEMEQLNNRLIGMPYIYAILIKSDFSKLKKELRKTLISYKDVQVLMSCFGPPPQNGRRGLKLFYANLNDWFKTSVENS